MNVKKTIRIPVAIGVVAAALILLASEADSFFPLSKDTEMGIGELFRTFSAGVGAPIASIVTLLLAYSIHTLLHLNQYTEMRSTNLIIVDATAHLCAMLLVATVYYKLLYPRMRKSPIFLGGWWLTVGAYCFLALLPLSVLLLNLADPGLGAPYLSFARDFFPGLFGTALITTMIWFASPAHYRKPRWVEPKQTPDQRGKAQDARIEGIP